MGTIDIVLGSISGTLSVIFLIATLRFPEHSIGIDPRVFPLFVILPTLGLSVSIVIRGIRALQAQRSRQVEHEQPDTVSTQTKWKPWLALGVLLLAMLAYALTLEPLGYVIVTPILMALGMYLFGARKLPLIVITALVTTALLYLIFRGFFRVPLPRSFFW
ncbi:MAG: tripartite tricarboxylate transporter TctB family protein [Rectinema sp.]|nr:tripartite tricarboxylate transporter TctB family protein [Rectinema sp.]